MLHRTGAASLPPWALQQRLQLSPVTLSWPTGAGTGQRGLKDKAETKVGCASGCSVALWSPLRPVTLQDRGWALCPGPRSTLCHSSARLCCSPGLSVAGEAVGGG